jgi:hypothetical protein
MRRGYAIVVPRRGLPKVGLERLLISRGLHGFPDAAPTAGDAVDPAVGDVGEPAAAGCADETDLYGTLIGRRCLLQWTLYEEQALNSASEPNIHSVLIIPP